MPKKDAGPKVGLRGSRRTLAFGLVRVGVGMAPLIETEKRIAGKMLDPEHLLPVKQKWETAAGDEIARGDIVKGYQYGDGFVVLEDGEVPKETGTDEINLAACIAEADVPHEYVEKPYLVWPSQGQEDSYAVVLAYLRDNAKAFVGTTTDGGTTKAFVVRYSDRTKTLVAELLNYDRNVRWAHVEAVTSFMAEVPEPTAEYVAAAGQIFDGLEDDFDWAAVTDTYGEALAEAVAQKAAGGAVSVPDAPEADEGTPDLMAALRATVEGGKVAA